MASLDMSLDDMIKSRRSTERGRGRGSTERGRGRGRPQGGRGGSFSGGRMTGVPRRGGGGPLRVNTTRPSAHTIAKSSHRTKSLLWQRDLLEESLRAVGLPGIENGAKLFVSNLDGGVSNEDIRELFSEIGELKRYAIHYGKNGQPSGSAEVVFARRSDAFQAMKRYNNVQLDGKPMKIEIVGANSEIPVSVSARVNVVGGVNGRRTVVMTPEMGRGPRGRGAAAVNRISGQRSRGGMMNGPGGRGPRGRGNSRGRGRGRGGGRGGKRNVDKSADQLDKELENYHADAMQT